MMDFFRREPLPKSLNICFIAERLPLLGFSGQHGFLRPIARRIVGRGHRVTFLSWRNQQHKRLIDQDGIQAHYLGEGTHAPISQFPEMAYVKFKTMHAQDPFHIVHSLDQSVIRIASEKRSLKVAVAIDARATSMAKMSGIIARRRENTWSLIKSDLRLATQFIKEYILHDRPLLKKADGVFVTSPQQQIILERYYSFPEWRTHRVPYGLDIGDISPRLKSAELIKKLGLPAQSHIVCSASDMTEVEDMRTILQAFAKVAVKKPTARMLIIGDGPSKSAIELEMLNLALGSRVFLVGNPDPEELAEYIALADVFVNLSSKSTGFEPDLLLAMALQKMIIGSEVSPIGTIVEDSTDGFLIRPADTPTLSKLIIKAIENPSWAQTVGERARRKITELFDMERMVGLTLQSFYQILKSTGRYQNSTASVQLATNAAGQPHPRS